MISATAQVVLTVSKPGEKGEVPVGVIAGSVIAGLVLLALAIGLLWKVKHHSYIEPTLTACFGAHPFHYMLFFQPLRQRAASQIRAVSDASDCAFLY